MTGKVERELEALALRLDGVEQELGEIVTQLHAIAGTAATAGNVLREAADGLAQARRILRRGL